MATTTTKRFTTDDLRVAIADELEDSEGVIVDLTGMTVAFRMTLEDSDSPKVDDAAATIDAAKAGQVSYSWVAADVNAAGTYDYQWIVTSDSKTEHFPVGAKAKVVFVAPV